MNKKNEVLIKIALSSINGIDDHSALHDILNEAVKRILEIRTPEESERIRKVFEEF